MNFLVMPPEVNSALMFAGPGSNPMLTAAAAWDGIGAQLSSAANAFSSVTADLAGSWAGPASASMAAAATPYAGWLAAAAAQAEESAGQAQAAAAAFEDARAAMVKPGLVAANRAIQASLIGTNLFGQNAPAIAAAEGAYEQMWAHAVGVMAGYHSSASAAVTQLTSWEQALEKLPGLPGQLARVLAYTTSSVGQGVPPAAGAIATGITRISQIANNFVTYIVGSPAGPPIPATQNPVYAGTPSLTSRIEAQGLLVVKNITYRIFGVDLFSALGPFISSPSPPRILTFLLGETVQTSTYAGMNVVQITPSHPSGAYVVGVHGGAYVTQPNFLNWLDYSLMSYQTGATLEVPIYPLAPQGTALTVVPAIAGLISLQITEHGASHVSVYGDSAGAGIALSAVEMLASTPGAALPASMVLLSPSLEPALTNPNISLAVDSLLNLGPLQQYGQEWAGSLPFSDYRVSPLYGDLSNLPPTYVYSGSLELLAPDVLALQQAAVMQHSPISFVLRNGEIHDWALGALGDSFGYRAQIYNELGI